MILAEAAERISTGRSARFPRIPRTNLNDGYNQSEVIHDLSFKVAPQEILAVVGRNGMGKTTLLKTLIGIMPLKGGAIRVGDNDISKLETHQRVAQGLAFVPQGRMIFANLTVMENMLTAVRGRLALSDLDEIYALFPVLRDMRQRKGAIFPGASSSSSPSRALLTNPKVLILDEPTEGIRTSRWSPPSSRATNSASTAWTGRAARSNTTTTPPTCAMLT